MCNQIKTHVLKKKKAKEEETGQALQKGTNEQLEELAQLLIDVYLNEIKNEQISYNSNGTDAGSENKVTV